MRTMKPLLTLAIIAALPCVSMADYTYNYVSSPALVPQNGTVTMASYNGPYTTATITNADAEHIATTAYVKGAYNDTIAGLNQKQDLLFVDGDEFVFVDNEVYGGTYFVNILAGEEDFELTDRNLVSGAAVQAGIKSQRVKIYTTWDDDRDSVNIPLETVLPED